MTSCSNLQEVERRIKSHDAILASSLTEYTAGNATPIEVVKAMNAVWELMDEREIVLENQRVEKVVEEYLMQREEKGFRDEHSQEDLCPVCQDDLPALGAGTGRTGCECCGRSTCVDCFNRTEEQMMKLHSQVVACTMRGDERGAMQHIKEMKCIEVCPFCRAPPIEPDLPEKKQLRIRYERAAKNANEGKAWAEHMVGVMYQKGRGIRVDKAKAVKLFKRSAEQNYFPAQHDLATAYENGDGMEASNKEAFRYYELAALAGSVRSQSELGNKYMDQPSFFSEGTPGSRMNEEERSREAVRYFSIAANCGYDFAQKRLGWCFWHGKGTDTNIPLAIYWMTKAAVEGNSYNQKEAQQALVQLSLRGHRDCPFGGQLMDHSGYVLGVSPLPRAMYWAVKAGCVKGELV